MPFGLQSDILDRALPDALHGVLVQQTEALEALLHYAQGTGDTKGADKSSYFWHILCTPADRSKSVETNNREQWRKDVPGGLAKNTSVSHVDMVLCQKTTNRNSR